MIRLVKKSVTKSVALMHAKKTSARLAQLLNARPVKKVAVLMTAVMAAMTIMELMKISLVVKNAKQRRIAMETLSVWQRALRNVACENARMSV